MTDKILKLLNSLSIEDQIIAIKLLSETKFRLLPHLYDTIGTAICIACLRDQRPLSVGVKIDNTMFFRGWSRLWYTEDPIKAKRWKVNCEGDHNYQYVEL